MSAAEALRRCPDAGHRAARHRPLPRVVRTRCGRWCAGCRPPSRCWAWTRATWSCPTTTPRRPPTRCAGGGRAGAALLLPRGRHVQGGGQGGLRPRQARRGDGGAAGRGGRASWRRCRCARCRVSGRAPTQRLRAAGLETIGDLAALDDDALRRSARAATAHDLRRRARGIDPRPVAPIPAERISISCERTFARDVGSGERAGAHRPRAGRAGGRDAARARALGPAPSRSSCATPTSRPSPGARPCGRRPTTRRSSGRPPAACWRARSPSARGRCG